MHNLLKKGLTALCIVLSIIDVSSFGMGRAASAAWQSAKTRAQNINPKLLQYIQAQQAAAKSKFTLGLQYTKALDPKIKALIAANVVATGLGAQYIPQHPALTKENVAKYGEPRKEYFTQEALKYISLDNNYDKNQNSIDAIQFLLTHYPETATTFNTAALYHSINLSDSMLQTFFDYSPEFPLQYIKAVLEWTCDGWQHEINQRIIKDINKIPEKHLSFDELNQLLFKIQSASINQFREEPILQALGIVVQRYYEKELEKNLKELLQDPRKFSVPHLELLYNYVYTNDIDRQKIKDAALKYFDKLNIADPKSIQATPIFMFECTPEMTVSECYVSSYVQAVKELMNTKDFQNPQMKNMLSQAFVKQQEETQKGNHVFFHGRSPEWEFIADIGKQVYNLAHPDKKMANDYVFLRFNEKHGILHQGEDVLWMNAALHGNATRAGSCTASFVAEGRDFSGGPQKKGVTLQSTFEQFKLGKYQNKYQKEFNQLEKLYVAANPKKYGNLLAISIPEQELHRVKSPQMNAIFPWNCRSLKDVIKDKKVGVQDEFVLPLTPEYALDPQNGPRIYSFNAADPEKYKLYEEYRDQLFAKIQGDIKTDNQTSFNK